MKIHFNISRQSERERFVEEITRWLGYEREVTEDGFLVIGKVQIDKENNLIIADEMEDETVERLLQFLYDEGFESDLSYKFDDEPQADESNEDPTYAFEDFNFEDVDITKNAAVERKPYEKKQKAKETEEPTQPKAVIPAMIAKGGGKIINICSMMSELGRETVSAYAAAKGGLKMLTRNIASEYGEYNIQCNGIGPGYIATPQTAPLREIQPDGERHPFDKFIIAKTPAARWGAPEDLMGPAIFLASEASNFVNGQVLYVDGGILAYIGKQPK